MVSMYNLKYMTYSIDTTLNIYVQCKQYIKYSSTVIANYNKTPVFAQKIPVIYKHMINLSYKTIYEINNRTYTIYKV